jgi:polysaccharide export outer membrane protein
LETNERKFSTYENLCSTAVAKPAKVEAALAYHWLVQMRGGEKVLEELSKLFPSAPIFTVICGFPVRARTTFSILILPFNFVFLITRGSNCFTTFARTSQTILTALLPTTKLVFASVLPAKTTKPYRMKLTPILLHLMLLIALGASPLRAQEKSDPVNTTNVTTQEVAAVPTNYQLSPGDLIYVKVFQEDDLCSSLRISEDGTITFPLIGSVKVGGLTIAQATQAIYAPLDARFLVNPQISVTVLSFTDRHVTVLGQVQHAGDYNLKEQGSVDFLEAIGLAGGFTRLANTSDVTVRRVLNGKTTIIRVNAKKITNDSGTLNFEVLPGDIITVKERIF